MTVSHGRIPHDLAAAHGDLVAALDEGIEQYKKNLRYSNSNKVSDAIERFVKEFCLAPERVAELTSRAELVTSRCGQDTEFRRLMDLAFASYNAKQVKAVGAEISPARFAVQHLKPRIELRSEDDLAETVEMLKLAERTGVIPVSCREAFRLWLVEVRQIVFDAKRAEADGCFYLLGILRARDFVGQRIG